MRVVTFGVQPQFACASKPTQFAACPSKNVQFAAKVQPEQRLNMVSPVEHAIEQPRRLNILA